MALVPPCTETGLGSPVEGLELKCDRVGRWGRVGEGRRLTVGDSGSHLRLSLYLSKQSKWRVVASSGSLLWNEIVVILVLYESRVMLHTV